MPVGAIAIGIFCCLPKSVIVLAALRDVDERARLEPDAFERRAVVAQRHFVFGAAVDELEKPLGQPALRDLAQVEDVVGARDTRASPF